MYSRSELPRIRTKYKNKNNAGAGAGTGSAGQTTIDAEKAAFASISEKILKKLRDLGITIVERGGTQYICNNIPLDDHDYKSFKFFYTSTDTDRITEKKYTFLDAYAHWMVYAHQYATTNPFLTYVAWKGHFVDKLKARYKNELTAWYKEASKHHQPLVLAPTEETITATLFAPCSATETSEQCTELQRRVTTLTQHQGPSYSIDRLGYLQAWAGAFHIERAVYPFYFIDIGSALMLKLAKDYGILVHTTHTMPAVFTDRVVQRQFIPAQVNLSQVAPLSTQTVLVPVHYEIVDKTAYTGANSLLHAWAQWQMLSTIISNPMSRFSTWCNRPLSSGPDLTWLCSMSNYAGKATPERAASPVPSTSPDLATLLEQYLLPELVRMGYPLPTDLDPYKVDKCLTTCNQLILGRIPATFDENDDLGAGNRTEHQLNTLLDTLCQTRTLVSSLIDFHSQMDPEAERLPFATIHIGWHARAYTDDYCRLTVYEGPREDLPDHLPSQLYALAQLCHSLIEHLQNRLAMAHNICHSLIKHLQNRLAMAHNICHSLIKHLQNRLAMAHNKGIDAEDPLPEQLQDRITALTQQAQALEATVQPHAPKAPPFNQLQPLVDDTKTYIDSAIETCYKATAQYFIEDAHLNHLLSTIRNVQKRLSLSQSYSALQALLVKLNYPAINWFGERSTETLTLEIAITTLHRFLTDTVGLSLDRPRGKKPKHLINLLINAKGQVERLQRPLQQAWHRHSQAPDSSKLSLALSALISDNPVPFTHEEDEEETKDDGHEPIAPSSPPIPTSAFLLAPLDMDALITRYIQQRAIDIRPLLMVIQQDPIFQLFVLAQMCGQLAVKCDKQSEQYPADEAANQATLRKLAEQLRTRQTELEAILNLANQSTRDDPFCSTHLTLPVIAEKAQATSQLLSHAAATLPALQVPSDFAACLNTLGASDLHGRIAFLVSLASDAGLPFSFPPCEASDQTAQAAATALLAALDHIGGSLTGTTDLASSRVSDKDSPQTQVTLALNHMVQIFSGEIDGIRTIHDFHATPPKQKKRSNAVPPRNMATAGAGAGSGSSGQGPAAPTDPDESPHYSAILFTEQVIVTAMHEKYCRLRRIQDTTGAVRRQIDFQLLVLAKRCEVLAEHCGTKMQALLKKVPARPIALVLDESSKTPPLSGAGSDSTDDRIARLNEDDQTRYQSLCQSQQDLLAQRDTIHAQFPWFNNAQTGESGSQIRILTWENTSDLRRLTPSRRRPGRTSPEGAQRIELSGSKISQVFNAGDQSTEPPFMAVDQEGAPPTLAPTPFNSTTGLRLAKDADRVLQKAVEVAMAGTNSPQHRTQRTSSTVSVNSGTALLTDRSWLHRHSQPLVIDSCSLGFGIYFLGYIVKWAQGCSAAKGAKSWYADCSGAPATPSPSPSVTPSPSPTPTVTRTPTPMPSPSPTPAPNCGHLSVTPGRIDGPPHTNFTIPATARVKNGDPHWLLHMQYQGKFGPGTIFPPPPVDCTPAECGAILHRTTIQTGPAGSSTTYFFRFAPHNASCSIDGATAIATSERGVALITPTEVPSHALLTLGPHGATKVVEVAAEYLKPGSGALASMIVSTTLGTMLSMTTGGYMPLAQAALTLVCALPTPANRYVMTVATTGLQLTSGNLPGALVVMAANALMEASIIQGHSEETRRYLASTTQAISTSILLYIAGTSPMASLLIGLGHLAISAGAETAKPKHKATAITTAQATPIPTPESKTASWGWSTCSDAAMALWQALSSVHLGCSRRKSRGTTASP